MRPVIQAEVTGCGIASVAAIAGVPYARAKKIANSFGICARDEKLWSETAYVRRILNHYRFRAKTGEFPFFDPGTRSPISLCSRSNGTSRSASHFGTGWVEHLCLPPVREAHPTKTFVYSFEKGSG
jgi:hypothetical protein